MERKLLTGSEALRLGQQPMDMTIGQFWAWSSSDLLVNTLRGAFGEFMVGTALGIDLSQGRADWREYDLQYGKYKIEVKTSAYLQAWNAEKISDISFGIGPSRAWSLETRLYSPDAKRHADVYVFCVLAWKDRATVDPLDMNQWDFYVLRSDILNSRCPNQKNISLSSLSKLVAKKIPYQELMKEVDRVLESHDS